MNRATVEPPETRNQSKKRAAEKATNEHQKPVKRGARKPAKEVLPPVHPETVVYQLRGALGEPQKPFGCLMGMVESWKLSFDEILAIINAAENRLRPREPHIAESLLMYAGIASGGALPRYFALFEQPTDWQFIVESWKRLSTAEGNTHVIHFVSCWQPLPPTPTIPAAQNIQSARAASSSAVDIPETPSTPMQAPSVIRSTVTTRREAQVPVEVHTYGYIAKKLRELHSCTRCSITRNAMCYRSPGLSEHCVLSNSSVNEWVTAITNGVAEYNEPPPTIREWKQFVKDKDDALKLARSMNSSNHSTYDLSPVVSNRLFQTQQYVNQAYSPHTTSYELSQNTQRAVNDNFEPESSPAPVFEFEVNEIRSWLEYAVRKAPAQAVVDVQAILDSLEKCCFTYDTLRDALCDMARETGKIRYKECAGLESIGLTYPLASLLLQHRKAWRTWFKQQEAL